MLRQTTPVQLRGYFATRHFAEPLLVEIAFRIHGGLRQLRRRIELPRIGGLEVDRTTRAFDQPFGPGMTGLGETVPSMVPPTLLCERMHLGVRFPSRPFGSVVVGILAITRSSSRALRLLNQNIQTLFVPYFANA